MTNQEGSGTRILVIDDELEIRETLQIILNAEGYEVTAVADGRTALAAATRERFEVATIDLRMPGMSGRDTLAALRKQAPEIAVVVVSGYVTSAEADACLALGAVSILRKPFTLDRLLEVLHQARSRSRPAPGIPQS
jgi:CheY-like chemotaxis protein